MSTSASGKRIGQPSRYLNGGSSLLVRRPFEPDDRIEGAWPRAELLKMDQRFCTAMERAFARGRESRSSASNQQRPGAGDLDRLAS